MAMLADSVEVVIGVDTHKHTHTAAVVAVATGATTATITVAATIGPTPGRVSRSGRQARTSTRMAWRWSAASLVSSLIRRAKLRSVAAVLLFSTSQPVWSRSRAQAATSWRVEWVRSRSRKTSGAATTRAWSWRWASPAAWTAERRAASRTDNAARGPVARGWASWSRPKASRAALVASSGSDLAPWRRAARLGRSNSTTCS